MIEYAQWPAVILTIINMIITITDKKIFKFFQNKAATTPKSAISIETLNPLFCWGIRRLRHSGFIQNEQTNSYYFDESIYKTRRKTRRFRALIIVVFVTLIILSIILAK